MKQLLIYTSPDTEFNKQHDFLARFQIDNSLQLGWKKEDIILSTNFPYEYKGVKSLLVNGVYCEKDPTSNKMFVLDYLFKSELLEKEHLYWYHDFDAYENNLITEKELGLLIVLTSNECPFCSSHT